MVLVLRSRPGPDENIYALHNVNLILTCRTGAPWRTSSEG